VKRVYSTLNWTHDEFCRLKDVEGELQVQFSALETLLWNDGGEFRDAVVEYANDVLRSMAAPLKVKRWKAEPHVRPVGMVLTLTPDEVEPLPVDEVKEYDPELERGL
jgi:hypothetical protein